MIRIFANFIMTAALHFGMILPFVVNKQYM